MLRKHILTKQKYFRVFIVEGNLTMSDVRNVYLNRFLSTNHGLPPPPITPHPPTSTLPHTTTPTQYPYPTRPHPVSRLPFLPLGSPLETPIAGGRGEVDRKQGWKMTAEREGVKLAANMGGGWPLADRGKFDRQHCERISVLKEVSRAENFSREFFL